MLYLPVLYGTARDGRKSLGLARYAFERLAARPGVETRFFDAAELAFGDLVHREWEWPEGERPPKVAEFADEMARADGFVLVAPEYNHGYPGALKNMIDALEDAWRKKPFAIVACGGVSAGMRMTEQLRLVILALDGVPIHATVNVQFVAKVFDAHGPTGDHDAWDKRFDKTFTELEGWARTLADARVKA